MSRSEATFIGVVRNVTGAVASVHLREDLASTLIMVSGESHRIGQIGSYVRIPLGYASLFGVVTQVGAAAAPSAVDPGASDAHRWISVVLFGESVSGVFERGIGQYPTVGDDAHVVTTADLETIYGSTRRGSEVVLGSLSSSPSIPGTVDLERLVTRHLAIVGSTGAGKSNLVTILLEATGSAHFAASRIIIVDAHGEYAGALGADARVFSVRPTGAEEPLYVPFWALPADEFIDVVMGGMQPAAEASVRDAIADLRRAAATKLGAPPPAESVTADSPVPFSAKKLWFQLDDAERMTIQDRATGAPAVRKVVGDAEALRSNEYPPPGLGSAAPFLGNRKGIARQLDLMKRRLSDSRFAFLFSPGGDLTPSPEGAVRRDLDGLVASWVGHDRPITVLDVSGVPHETLVAITGTVLRIVYDTLFWAGDTPIGGRRQPLLIVLEEAHRVIPTGVDSSARRIVSRIAKEGRKYGVGMAIVTQRPTEIDASVLSQCGTMIALRTSNSADRAVIASVMPDDLGNLAAMLPALRTGEGLAVGEAVPIPTRIRFRHASAKTAGSDPPVAASWRAASRPDPSLYAAAIANWRKQSF